MDSGGQHIPGPEPEPPTSSDAALIAGIRLHDVAALEVFFERYKSRAYGQALSILHSEKDAEDVTQEFFAFKVWHRRLDRFAGNSSFGTWMYIVIKNDCLAVIRTRNRHQKAIAELLAWLDAEDPGPFPRAIVFDEQFVAKLFTLIEKLPVDQKEVVILSWIDGLDVPEIAKRLQRSEQAVYNLRNRAREGLRRLVLQHLKDDQS